MPPSQRFEPSIIKNKIKREEVSRKLKKDKRQDKLKRRLAQAKAEKTDPASKKVGLIIRIISTEWFLNIHAETVSSKYSPNT